MKRRLLYQRLHRRFHLEHGNISKEEIRNFACGDEYKAKTRFIEKKE